MKTISILMIMLAAFAAGAAAQKAGAAKASKNSPKPKEAKMMIAKGTFDVKTTPQAADDAASAGPFGRLFLDKQFHGDLDGRSLGQMLGSQSPNGSGGYVAMEEFTGTLAGKKGTFVLMHNGTMKRGGDFVLSVSVVPDSGTGDLTGLSGTLKIIIDANKHS